MRASEASIHHAATKDTAEEYIAGEIRQPSRLNNFHKSFRKTPPKRLYKIFR